MLQWYEVNEIEDELIRFVVLVTEYRKKLVIIKNKKRGGWEIPGGNREKDETLLAAAARELYEETGAVHFDLEPFGVYLWNGSYGMIFFTEVYQFEALPQYEIEELKFVDKYPEGLNFGEMFYIYHEQWTKFSSKGEQKYSIDNRKKS